ncbi:protein LONGIFOLIA 1 [Impatiens glandulifera]|uniref:protein LONGIFOLIA 1 n=1 Tax=Impatiens glandulifera TaxID=253017 RepID=UPI001FB15857|nr:protein LONGIFOLIA 1 [Impatiens glandulifera]
MKTSAIVHERKQMGCMAGFFHMFDRHHILTGKRLHSTKRLPPPPGPPPAMAPNSPPESKQIQPVPPVDLPLKRPFPLATFEFKERSEAKSYPWKLSKETPRLSLDSRATFDSKGSLQPLEIRTKGSTVSSRRSECSQDRSVSNADDDKHLRSPGVVARLMGLELLPQMNASPVKNELRRSASESRIAREVFLDNFQDQSKNLMMNKQSNVKRNNAITGITGSQTNQLKKATQQQQQPKSFFNSADFFPEPKHEEMEKRLRMRGMDEQFKDLEALKNILETLQFKGLLHSSNKISDQPNKRNFVLSDEYPIVVMKPSRLAMNRGGNNSSTNLRSREDLRRGTEKASQAFNSVSPRRQSQPPEVEQGRRSQTNVKNKERIPNSSVGRRSPSQKKANEFTEQRRSVSPVHSPRPNLRRNGSNQSVTPKNKKQMAAEITSGCQDDESSSVSESSVSNFSQTERERSRWEEYKGGKSLIERCDKLLHSIAEINATDSESQPSPVSVLDYYKDESASPSPILRRTINFKESDEEIWSPAAVSPMDEPNDIDFAYFTKILRASSGLPQEQEYQKLGKTGRSNRKLIMDAVSEIIKRKEQLPPWESEFDEKKAWMEFESMREREVTDENDVYEMVCAALRKDLAGDAMNGWRERRVEIGETVVDIERLIFKDLIEESIRDVAFFGGKTGSVSAEACRRLDF